MGLNKKEEEILKQIELGLSVDDPKLEKAVESLTLSNFSRSRSIISGFTFLIGFLIMIASYIPQPIVAVMGFVLMALSGYVFVTNTRALLKAENINEWNFKQIFNLLRNKDSSRQNK
ncbi:MAG: DUF3040 domain-containing protein [Candidatus Actinomarinales bacterium]|nr:MAG: DUF3040 domain-containing protein [Candidatus Actinomarinales bacterium]